MRVAAQEDGSATETDVPSAPAGSEQPGDKVEVPDVSPFAEVVCPLQSRTRPVCDAQLRVWRSCLQAHLTHQALD